MCFDSATIGVFSVCWGFGKESVMTYLYGISDARCPSWDRQPDLVISLYIFVLCSGASHHQDCKRDSYICVQSASYCSPLGLCYSNNKLWLYESQQYCRYVFLSLSLFSFLWNYSKMPSRTLWRSWEMFSKRRIPSLLWKQTKTPPTLGKPPW